MEPIEIAQKRKLAGLSTEQLADDLGVSVERVREWETGARKMASKEARFFNWFVAAAERQAAVAQSGLPECEWMSRWDNQELLTDPEKELESVRALEKHQDECPTCRARTAYLEERFPPLPPLPLPWWQRALGPILDLDDRLRGFHRVVVVSATVPLLFSLGWLLGFAPRSWPFQVLTYFAARGGRRLWARPVPWTAATARLGCHGSVAGPKHRWRGRHGWIRRRRHSCRFWRGAIVGWSCPFLVSNRLARSGYGPCLRAHLALCVRRVR